jgi:HSP20 family protein
MVPRVERPFGLMLEEFPALFNRFFPHFPIEETAEWPYGWGMTMEEKDKELLVRLELPGFEPAEVNVEVMPERLTIEAEHKEPAEKDKAERAYAHVKRVVTLPPDVDPEKAEALYRNGILEIRLPRRPEAVGRRLELKK